jgi:hypothetical protein
MKISRSSLFLDDKLHSKGHKTASSLVYLESQLAFKLALFESTQAGKRPCLLWHDQLATFFFFYFATSVQSNTTVQEFSELQECSNPCD